MEEMEIPVTAAQLAKPTHDVVGPLFETVLISLTGITRHVTDIYKPESARLRRHLSALVNFAKFREEKLVAYSEMSAELDSLVEEQRQLQELLAQKGASGVRAEVAELTSQNQALNKSFIALAGEVKALKAQCNSLADAAQAEKFELLSAKQENDRLQDQIVQSPEKFQRSLAELTAAVEAERAQVEEADRACSELAARQDMVGKVDKEVAKCTELMAELETAVQSKKQQSRSAKELREAISGAQLDAGDLEQQQQHLKRQLATLADRIKRLESQAAVKKEAMESSIEEQLRDKEAVQAENAAQQALILQHEAETRAMSDKTSEVKQRHQAAVAGLLKRYGQLRGEVANYNNLMEKVMQQQQVLGVAGADANTGRDQN
eukprot:gene4190-4438_t